MKKISTGIFEVDLAAAVKALREKLGKDQEDMPPLIGCRIRAYQHWEAGTTAPGGEFLIKLIRLCPDIETLARFGIDRPSPGHRPQDGYYKLREDLEAVIASGQSQLIGQVEEMLDRCAENARHMTRKNKRDKLERAVRRHVPVNVGSQENEN